MHRDDQPLRVAGAVHAAELRDVGVDREFLTRHQQVRVHDRRRDHRPPVEPARGIREFASRELALPDNGSYSSYAELHRPYVAWNVYAAPVFSIVMPWMGIVFTGTLWTLSFALLGAAMLRHRILPRLPVVLFGFSAAATVALAAVVTAFGHDAGFVWVVPLVLQSAGFAWLGWAMWREEVVATPGPGPWASAAA
jgi:hypothetical protein